MFKNDAAEFVYYRTYARWMEDQARRETWTETVDRVVKFLSDERGTQVPAKVFKKIREGMLKFDVMPSMRLVWSAGDAARQSNVCLYNCSFVAVDAIEAFSECLYILCCGTGVGFSVESKYTSKLPVVKPADLTWVPPVVTVEDSKEGWADSIKSLMTSLYEGKDIVFDYTSIRPKGARLKTMGGRASGPEPLILLHGFIRDVFGKAQGQQLTPLQCHDIMNKIAEIVVVGGVRRSSQISLSDLNNDEMRTAKEWPFPLHRAMANNSAVYHQKPSAIEFLKEWASLAASGTGERGIFNLYGAKKSVPARRSAEELAGTNPCGEIMLRDAEFCNLSSVVTRPNDDLDDLLDKVETAVWIGAIQASFTHFPYLREIWKKNCEEECLLGVSLSGQMDNTKLLTPSAMRALKAKAVKTAEKASKLLGINMPAAITCTKPEGTSSQLTYSGSGLHVWYSDYFIRRYRISAHDPLCKMLKEQGVFMEPENGQTAENANTWVIPFPMKAPKGAVTKARVNAIQQLEWYKRLQQNYCEHNASCTVYVKPHEWMEVGDWVYKNWDIVNGLSFLPDDGGRYTLAPLEEITKDDYDKMLKNMPKIDYSQLSTYELEDNTEGAKSYACTGGACEL